LMTIRIKASTISPSEAH